MVRTGGLLTPATRTAGFSDSTRSVRFPRCAADRLKTLLRRHLQVRETRTTLT